MQQIKILIVEDEQIVAAELREIIHALGHCVVATASTGAEALARTEQVQLDVILMDVRIKGEIDGIETASRISASRNIPIIYVTAHADRETLCRAKLTGPMGYVLKPFSERELQIAIEMAIYKHEMAQQMKEQRQKLSAVLDSIGDAVIATDKHGLVTLFNPGAAGITGFTEAEALGREITTVLNIMNESAQSTHYASMIIAKSGKVVPIDGTTSHMRDEKGERLGTVFVFRDASASSRQMEAAHITHFSVDQAPDLILQIASDGLIMEVNQTACDMLGYPREEILNAYTYELEVYSSQSQWLRLWEKACRERVVAYETSYWTRNHATLPVDVRAAYVRSMGKEFIFAIARPITKAEELTVGNERTGTGR